MKKYLCILIIILITHNFIDLNARGGFNNGHGNSVSSYTRPQGRFKDDAYFKDGGFGRGFGGSSMGFGW